MNSKTQKKKYGYKHINQRAYHIVVAYVDLSTGQLCFAKYHNIGRSDATLRQFFQFAQAKFGAVQHCNLYDPTRPKGENFVRQEREFFKK